MDEVPLVSMDAEGRRLMWEFLRHRLTYLPWKLEGTKESRRIVKEWEGLRFVLEESRDITTAPGFR